MQPPKPVGDKVVLKPGNYGESGLVRIENPVDAVVTSSDSFGGANYYLVDTCDQKGFAVTDLNIQ